MKMPKPKLSTVGHAALFLGVAILLAINAAILYGMQKKVGSEKRAIEEAAKPAELRLTVLTTPDCAECADVNLLIAPFKNNAKIKIAAEQSFAYTSDEAVALIQKYVITRVPTLIIQGDTEKIFDAASFVQNIGRRADDGALVVTNVPPPYTEVASGAVKGRFTVTYLTDQGCKECYDPRAHRQALAALAMKPVEEKFIDRASREGRQLISKYRIESTPTILLTGELSEYLRFEQAWPSVGTAEEDGTYVFRAGQALMGAYYNLKTRKVVKPEPPPEQTQ